MREYYKEKVKSLTSLRSNLFTCVIVLTGGLVGLFFSQAPIIAKTVFLLFGFYFDIVFFINLITINTEIDKYIERLKQ